MKKIRTVWLQGILLTIQATIFSLPVCYQEMKIKTYKIMILRVVVSGCETWYVALTENDWDQFAKEKMEKRKEEAGENYIMNSFMVCTCASVI
jgi:hypothetical protein